MQVGDLAVQVGWDAAGAGIVLSTRAQRYATVVWPGGEVEMLLSDLEVISESR